MKNGLKWVLVPIFALTIGFAGGELLQAPAAASAAAQICPYEECHYFGEDPEESCVASASPTHCWLKTGSTEPSTPECNQCECGAVDCPPDPVE